MNLIAASELVDGLNMIIDWFNGLGILEEHVEWFIIYYFFVEYYSLADVRFQLVTINLDLLNQWN